MSDLRESLDEALRTVIAGDPPVQEAIRRGKAIKTRRRACSVAAVAVAAVFGVVGYPALAHRQAAPAPVTPAIRHGRVTDVPPSRGAHAGMIASGTVDGQSWEVYTDNPKTNGAPGQQCLAASGPAFGPGTQPLYECLQPAPPGTANPVDFEGIAAAGGHAQASFGTVRADVSHVLVRLSDGTVLKLIPVTVYGTRFVAFASPPSAPVASATAYLTDGRYLTAIPYNGPGGLPAFVQWLPPGQPVPPRVTKQIAAGSAAGTRWAVRAVVGPWGTCFAAAGLDAGMLGCIADTGSSRTRMLVFPDGSPGMVAGSAPAGVAYLTIALTDGRTLRVTPVPVGRQRYFAFHLDKGKQAVRQWTAYDAAGKRLSSGTLN